MGENKGGSEYTYESGKDTEKYEVTIQAYNVSTLTGVSFLNLLNNNDHIMYEIRNLCLDAINNRANDGHTLHPPTVEEFYTILNLHRDLFKYQDAVYSHLRLIKPIQEEKMDTRRIILTMKRLWLDMDLYKTPKAYLIFDHAAYEQDIFDGMGENI